MPFQKGESGNPAGRPRGARNRTTVLLENLLAVDAEAIGRKAIELAKAGDIAAIRMCMDRLAPARKDEPVVFDLPPLATAADSVAAAASIVAAVAGGELARRKARTSRGDRRLRGGARGLWLRGTPDQARKRGQPMRSGARHRTRACDHRDANRRLQETTGHSFRPVLYNEKTYHNV